jgi:ribosome recycling factor
MSTSEYLQEVSKDMEAALEQFRRELSGVRTGRATPALIEFVQVHVASYGSSMPLKQLGSIGAPDARLLIVNPWDKSTLADIDKAIRSAGLGLNPTSDGQVLRVPIPALTGERRQDLVKQVKKIAEDARIRVRNVRREYNDLFKGMHDDKDITEDELKRTLEKVQQTTDGFIKKIDEAAEKKEKEVLEV